MTIANHGAWEEHAGDDEWFATHPHAYKDSPNFAECCDLCGEPPTHDLHNMDNILGVSQ